MERILIVDDDLTFALMLRTWLAKQGFEVETASSVAAARTALAKGAFSLVLSDMRLPDEDGIALLQFLVEISDATRLDPLLASITRVPSVYEARRLMPGEGATQKKRRS